MRTIATEGLGPSAVFALPWLVAQDEGYFAEDGLDVRFVANRSKQNFIGPITDPLALETVRTHVPFEEGETDVYGACEWGQIRRARDSVRGGRILGKRSAIAAMAIFAAPGTPYRYPQTLRNREISVSFHNGNHYAALQMLEGFVDRSEIRLVGQHTPAAYEALLAGELAAICVPEPWITLAEKHGCQRIIEVHYLGLEIGAPELERETYEALVRAVTRAVALINEDKRRHLHYLLDALPAVYRGALDETDFYLPRLRYVDPEPYTAEEFEKTKAWMTSWNFLQEDVDYHDLVVGRA